ncbi:MAG: type II toxin-antitoxin system VapB family antitoxin [Verrucomicrobiales bacterium]
MTMHIDDSILESVMADYGFETKTEAVNFALSELSRRKKLRAFMEKGLGFSPAELKASVSEDYDLEGLRVAETPANYDPKKP